MIDRGSDWRRWEPHIHAPGTALNDQFGGPGAWDEWLIRIETASPKIEALAVTDYHLTNTYQEVLRHKTAGRLPDVQLVFPNIEMRINAAAKSGFVNLHLLVSPEDPNHVEELGRFVRRLTTRAYKDTFSCTRDDVIALGKAADPRITEDGAALSYGATQFKVDFDQLKDEWKNSDWARQNILVAVAGGSGDGTSGIRDAADTTTRREIEAFADIIFSGNPAQREFWSGLKGPSRDELIEHVACSGGRRRLCRVLVYMTIPVFRLMVSGWPRDSQI